MKKLTFILGLAMALSASVAQASTISLSPTTVSVVRGQTVTVTVSVDSAGAKLTTVESNISYPSSILTPTSFSFAPNWMQLSQSGYDQMSGGTVIKTAGYPGGFTGTKTLGTLTFTAIANGTGSIQVQNSSLAYNTGNQNTLSGTQGSAQVSVIGSSPSPLVTTTAVNANTSASNGTAPSGQTTNNAAAAASGASPAPATSGTAVDTTQQPAAVGATSAGTSSFPWLWVLAAIVVLGLGGWAYYSYSKKA